VITDNAITVRDVERQILTIGENATVEQVQEAITRVDWFMGMAREMKAKLEQALIEYIEANGDITIGTVRYYVGHPKETKCVNVAGAVEALLQATGGDFEKVCECLSGSAVKPGATRKVLPEDVFAGLFETTEKVTLEEGKPKKAVQKIDTKYLK
jgi:hypothetical protein